MCVAFLPFPTSSFDCTPRTELTGMSASKMGDEEEEAAESGGNGWDVSPTLLVLALPLLVYKGFMCVAFLPFPMFSSDCTGERCHILLPFPGSTKGGAGGSTFWHPGMLGGARQSDLSSYSKDGMDGEFLNVLSLVRVNCATRQSVIAEDQCRWRCSFLFVCHRLRSREEALFLHSKKDGTMVSGTSWCAALLVEL